jgi:hypothetical protein
MASSGDSRPTTIFVLGLLSIVACPLLGPVAWQQGNNYYNECLFDAREPEQLAQVGRILGMVGTALFALNFALFFFACCLSLAAEA